MISKKWREGGFPSSFHQPPRFMHNLFIVTFNKKYYKGSKYQVLFTHKLISTYLRYIQDKCKKRFTVSWLWGRNNLIFIQKIQNEENV